MFDPGGTTPHAVVYDDSGYSNAFLLSQQRELLLVRKFLAWFLRGTIPAAPSPKPQEWIVASSSATDTSSSSDLLILCFVSGVFVGVVVTLLFMMGVKILFCNPHKDRALF